MASNVDPKASIPINIPALDVDASSHAPFLYFEQAPTFGYNSGTINITLEAIRFIAETPERVTAARVVIAHLRMNMHGALSLKSALEGALLIANPPATEARN